MLLGVTATELSENRKTGPCSTTMVAQTSCPSSCSFYGNGCYAETGPMAFQTRRMNSTGVGRTILELAHAEAEAISTRLSGRMDLRLHVVGDSSTNEAASIVATAALRKVKRGRTVWNYTHAWKDVDRSSWDEVSVLASCETPDLAKQAQESGWAVAIVVPEFKSERLYEDSGIKVLPCPHMTRRIPCVDCRLCLNSERLRDKGIAIGFEPHGGRRKVVGRIVEQQRNLIQMGGLQHGAA